MTVLITVSFAKIYQQSEEMSFLDAMLHSSQIQTLSGMNFQPKKDITKLVTIVHTLLSFIIGSGIVVFYLQNKSLFNGGVVIS